MRILAGASAAFPALVAHARPEPPLRAADLGLAALEHTPEAARGEFAAAVANYVYLVGDVLGAEDCCHAGIEAATDPFVGVLVRVALAQLQRSRGAWDEGLRTLDEALELVEAGDTPRHHWARAYAFGERAQNLMGQGAFEPARATLAAELANAERYAANGAGNRLVEARRHELELSLATGSFTEAFRAIQEYRETPEFAGLPPRTRALFLAMGGAAVGELSRRRGAPEAWSEEADQWLASAEEAGLGALESARVVLLRAEYSWLRGEREAAFAHLERSAELLGELGRDVQSLQVNASRHALEVVFARERELAPDDRRALDQRFRRSFDGFLGAWTRTRTAGDTGYLRESARREILCRRIELSVGEGDAAGIRRGFEDLLTAQARGSVARESELAPPSVESVRETLLGPGHGVVALVSGPSGGHVFAIDRERIAHAPLPREADVFAVCRELSRVVDLADTGASLDLESLDRARAEAAAMLLPPSIRSRLGHWSRLTVVGTDFLFEVPLECLPWKDGAWLGEALAVDRLPSLPVGLVLAERDTPARDAGLRLMAALEPGADPTGAALATIPASADDLARLTAGFDQADVVTDLTPSRFQAAPLHDRFAHVILCHGVYESTERRAGAALVLEADEDGAAVLRREDVLARDVSGHVLLAACEAGRALERWGSDRLASLGGAFLSAGAVSVIQTSARIPYRSALGFAEVVVARLAAGDPPAEAARRARAAAAERHPGVPERLRAARLTVLGLGQR